MTTKIAIIGGSGFVGSSIAAHLSKRHEVTILDSVQPNGRVQSRFLKCDVRKMDEVERALTDIDMVIHTAIVQIPQINDEKRLGYEANVLGTQNVCEAVRKSSTVKGMIVAGSWHTIGETKIEGVVDEKFGFRPDHVEDRARLYALSKIAQESIVRIYDEIESKTFAVIRIGTVLGENMQAKSAANIFIQKGLNGEALTPFSHSMYRPMLFVDIDDVCVAFGNLADRIMSESVLPTGSSLRDIYNVFYPEAFTILELAEIVKDIIRQNTQGRIDPEIRIEKTGRYATFSKDEKMRIIVNSARARELLGPRKLTKPSETLARVIKHRISLLDNLRPGD